MKNTSVVLVDDDSLITSLLQNFLNDIDGIQVLYTCQLGEELISKLKEKSNIPDVLVLDLNIEGGMNGIEVTKTLKAEFPEIKTIIMSSHYKKTFMGFMLKTGVSAFIPKGVSPQQLIEIINEVKKSGFFFLPDQMDIIRDQLSTKAPKPILDEKEGLSEREIEVLKLICAQKTAKEIAEILFLSARTVEGHKNNLFLKTGAKNIAGLVIYAVQNQIISAEEMPLIG